MRILSWNVNGLRSVSGKGFRESIRSLSPDILLLQETRVGAEGVDLLKEIGPWVSLNPAVKPGYAGTAIVSQKEPRRFFNLGEESGLSNEGRVAAAEFDDFYVLSVYSPNSQNELRRLAYRCGEWEPAFREAVQQLQREKPVVIGGDLNVAHEEIDLARPTANRRNAGFTDEERAALSDLLAIGLIDSFRDSHPGLADQYSWWSYRGGARARNVGWRIDYLLLSESLRPNYQAACIHSDIMGSDHCPVSVQF
jgi:exodeoxyribonuclease-3